MPVAGIFCENTAESCFFFNHEHYNVLKKKHLKANKTYTDYLLWDCTFLFSLWLSIIQKQM